MKIRSVIVDDEKIARDVLGNYLGKYCPSVELVGQAQHIKEAVPLIRTHKPDLVFLDVEMPYGNAFDILEACNDMQFETIFITAFSEYSIKALNQSASYYILKPIDISELISAVNKVQNALLKKEETSRTQVLLQNLKAKSGQEQIMLPTINGFDIIKAESITRMQAKGNFTEIFTVNGNPKLICKFLKHFDEILGDPFLRIHRSYIINLQYVKSYSRGTGGYVTMIDGTEIEVSATYKETFLKKLGAIPGN